MIKILIAVNDTQINYFLKSNLSSLQFNIQDVKTENDLLNYYDDNDIDIIICHVNFSKIFGYGIINEIKKKIKSKHAIFIYISNDTVGQKEIRKGMELGADDFIIYPISSEDLLATINAQVNKRKKLIKYIASDISQKSSTIKLPVSNKEQENKNHNDYIFLDDKNHPGFYTLKSVMYIRSLGDYTKICLFKKRKIVVHKTLTFWENYLPKPNFIRIHRQTIINIDYIERLERDNGYSYRVFLKDISEPFKISQRYSKKIRQTWGVN